MCSRVVCPGHACLSHDNTPPFTRLGQDESSVGSPRIGCVLAEDLRVALNVNGSSSCVNMGAVRTWRPCADIALCRSATSTSARPVPSSVTAPGSCTYRDPTRPISSVAKLASSGTFLSTASRLMVVRTPMRRSSTRAARSRPSSRRLAMANTFLAPSSSTWTPRYAADSATNILGANKLSPLTRSALVPTASCSTLSCWSAARRMLPTIVGILISIYCDRS